MPFSVEVYRKGGLALVGCSLLVGCSIAQVRSVEEPGWFPFVLPWDDQPDGSAIDVSFLNAKPAGKHGRIVARDGQFFESGTQKRIRFFATNLGASAAFPSRSDADKIAGRLAKMGVNLVRFHHINNGWDLNGGTLWKQGRTFIEIDPVQLDKLDYFIAALKKQGIYSNINLQTAREYLPELGLPESSRQLKNFGKRVDKFNERMIVLQEEFAKDLLDRRNPHTGLRYADDPALVKIEINNENSLVGWPGQSAGADLDGLPEPFRSDLVKLWNDWLTKTYKTQAVLEQAWPTNEDFRGPSVVNRQNAWTHENQSSGDVTFQPYLPATGEGSPGLRVTIKDNKGPNWHVQAHLAGLNLQNNESYVVEFRAKSDRPMTFGIDSRLDKPDWRFLGLGGSITTGTEFKTYSLSFRVTNSEPNHARIGLVLGDVRGTLEVENVRVIPGTRTIGVPKGESLGNISLPPADLSPRFRDYTRFLTELERSYSMRMRNYLRDKLGFRQTLIIDTQVAWGGLTSLVRERDMEFFDNHEYWNHPTFLGSDWDPKNYRVDRRALVNELGKSNGTLGSLARYRVAGKPYSVSEYNHPAPCDYQIEMMPLISTFAGFQNWDAIYTFAWDATGTGRENDRYENYFDMAKNPAKTAFFPIAALIFRQGLMEPSNSVRTLNLPVEPYAEHLTAWAAWAQKQPEANPLRERLQISTDPNHTSTAAESQTSPFQIAQNAKGQRVVIQAKSAVAVVGFVGGETCSFGDFGSVEFMNFGYQNEGFGALMVAAMDQKPLAQSNRVLVSVGGRVENVDMRWNAERNSVSDQWGKGPVMAETVPLSMNLKTASDRDVWALGPNGKRLRKVDSTYSNGTLRFQVDSSTRSMWLEIVSK